MNKTLKDKITRALDEAGARAREVAKSIGLIPNSPRLVPARIPVRSSK